MHLVLITMHGLRNGLQYLGHPLPLLELFTLAYLAKSMGSIILHKVPPGCLIQV